MHQVLAFAKSSLEQPTVTPPPSNRPRRKGRPAKYGKKIKVAALLRETDRLQEAPGSGRPASMARRG
jgi:hypothetical protein